MTYEIEKGNHRASGLHLGLHYKKTQEAYVVNFKDSCRYNLGNINQLDWNKLAGWSYGLHHNNSVRVAWRYNKDEDKIELALYAYVNGVRKISELKRWVGFNTDYVIKLAVLKGSQGYFPTMFILDGTNSTCQLNVAFKAPTWGYDLNPYFGGDEVAPHNMTIELHRR